jgi:hypothetical protein
MSNANQTFRGKASLELQGTRLLISDSLVTTPGTDQTLITYTVPVGYKINVLGIRVTSGIPIFWKYQVDSSIQASGRCHPGNPNDDYDFLPGDEVLTGSLVEIIVQSFSDRPASDVEGYIQARLIAV